MTRPRRAEQYVTIGHNETFFLAMRPEHYQVERVKHMTRNVANAPRVCRELEEDLLGERNQDTEQWYQDAVAKQNAQLQRDEEERNAAANAVAADRERRSRENKRMQRLNPALQAYLKASSLDTASPQPILLFNPSWLACNDFVSDPTSVPFVLAFGGLSHVFSVLVQEGLSQNQRQVMDYFSLVIGASEHHSAEEKFQLMRMTLVEFISELFGQGPLFQVLPAVAKCVEKTRKAICEGKWYTAMKQFGLLQSRCRKRSTTKFKDLNEEEQRYMLINRGRLANDAILKDENNIKYLAKKFDFDLYLKEEREQSDKKKAEVQQEQRKSKREKKQFVPSFHDDDDDEEENQDEEEEWERILNEDEV